MPTGQVHLCHRPGCLTRVPPRMLACRNHWFQLPKNLRDQIWKTYRPGQERDKNPSEEYLAAAMACRDFWNKSG